MSAPVTPYTKFLEGREPIAAMHDSVARIRALTRDWDAARFERSYGPGKWPARQVLTHLAQTEMALGTRARMALATANYAGQNFDQDDWAPRESRTSGADPLAPFLALARMNIVFFEGLSAADRATRMSHPEYGEITVDWILHQMAGHQINHLQQLEQIR